MQKGASIYSNPCNAVKITPREIVVIRDITDLEKFFLIFHGEIMLQLPPKIKVELYLLGEYL